MGQDTTDINQPFGPDVRVQGLFPFAICATFMAFDLLMGLDWVWFYCGGFIFLQDQLSAQWQLSY